MTSTLRLMLKSCPTGCGLVAMPGRLMCIDCWRLVPLPLQDEVSSTWRNYRRAFGGSASRTAIKVLMGDYRKAADAATTAAIEGRIKKDLRA